MRFFFCFRQDMYVKIFAIQSDAVYIKVNNFFFLSIYVFLFFLHSFLVYKITRYRRRIFSIVITMIALILSIILFAALYFYVKKKLNYWNERRVPNLNPKTPFGDILVCLINGKSVYDLTLEIFKKFKAEGHKYAGFYLTTGPIFIPIDLDLIRRILVKDYDYFCDRGFYFNNTKNIPFADNVFTAEQTRWKYLRDKINYLLLPLKLKNTIPIVDYYVKDYCKYLDENLGRDVDILDLSFRYTLDISCNLYMGLDEKNILENKSPIIHYAHQLSAIQLKNLFNSFLRFGTTKLTNLFTAIIYNSELHNFLYDYCTKAYNLRKNGKIKRDDALSEFIESSEVNNEPFDFEAFLGEMIILFGATVETSASSISYILYEIAKCEEYQRKLKEEIENMYKKNDEITYETINDLPYLDSLLSGKLLIIYLFLFFFV